MQQYKDMIKHIIDNGIKKEDRTGVGTISTFGYQTRFDLNEGFPMVTIKKTPWKPVVSELLWFLEGSTDERRLAELLYGRPRNELKEKRTIWTDNADKQGVDLGYENNDTVKHLGNVYGINWRNWYKPSFDIIDIEQKNNDIYEIFEIFENKPVVYPSKNDDFVGKIIKNSNGRSALVLEKIIGSKNTKYKIQFIDTGDVIETNRTNLKAGRFGKPLIFGIAVGCIGTKPSNRKIYDLWYNMISRCYDKNNRYYDYYGGSGVSVCGRWLRFENFYADISDIPGFYNWYHDSFNFNLDKDYYNSKSYGPNTCIFIPREMNLALSNSSIDHTYKRIVEFPDGKIFEFIYMEDLLHNYPEYKFNKEQVRQCLLDCEKTHRKCKFRKSEKGLYRKRLIFDQIEWLHEEIEHNPNSRRLVLSSWNVPDLDKMALPPCHTMFQFYVQNNKLSCQLYQRSCDAGLGWAFNVASYSLLTHMFAKYHNLGVGDFVHTIGDLHLYSDQIDGMVEAIERESFELPTLEIDDEFMDEFENNLNFKTKFSLNSVDKIKLVNYQAHPPIKFKMAV